MSEDAGPSPVAMLAEPHVLRLLQAFCALENMALRRSPELTEQMAALGASPSAREAKTTTKHTSEPE